MLASDLSDQRAEVNVSELSMAGLYPSILADLCNDEKPMQYRPSDSSVNVAGNCNPVDRLRSHPMESGPDQGIES